jgi:hypothetical protein
MTMNSAFNVQYQCNQDYSPSTPQTDDIFNAQKCTSEGTDYTFPVECIPKCRNPAGCNLDDSDCPFSTSSRTLSQIGFNLENLACNDAAGYAPVPGGPHVIACDFTDNKPEYEVSGCKLKCVKPANDLLYTYDPGTANLAADLDVFSVNGLSCAGSDKSTPAEAHVCNDYGQPFGLTGCYPDCLAATDCLNLRATYPLNIDITEAQFKTIVVEQLNKLPPKEGDPDPTFSTDDITYYNKVDTETGTIIDYQVPCPYENCELDFDDLPPNWLEEQQLVAIGSTPEDVSAFYMALVEQQNTPEHVASLPVCDPLPQTVRSDQPRGALVGAFIDDEGTSLHEQVQQNKTSCVAHIHGSTKWIGTNPDQPDAYGPPDSPIPHECPLECRCPDGTTRIDHIPTIGSMQTMAAPGGFGDRDPANEINRWAFACVDPCIGVNCENGGVCNDGYCDCSTTDTDGEGNPLWGGVHCSDATDAKDDMDLEMARLQALSDRRLKKDIRFVGLSPSGLRIYHFRYKDIEFGEGLFQGVMSDEIPEYAVIKHPDGYDRVNYNVLDVDLKLIN